MSLSEKCCTLPPVESDYTPIGKKEKVGDLEYYIIGDANSKATLIGIYDIFGFHNNTLQFVDILSKANFRVIIPDFFRNKPWSLDNFPPKDRNELVNWAVKENGWDNRIYKDLKTIVNHFNLNAEKDSNGVFGFCWGGKMAFEALKLKEPLFKAGAAIHPGFLQEQDFQEANCPLLFIPTDDEKKVIPYFELLKPEIKGKSELHDFTHTFHGFAAARGDFSNPENRENTTKAINITASFFNKVFS